MSVSFAHGEVAKATRSVARGGGVGCSRRRLSNERGAQEECEEEEEEKEKQGGKEEGGRATAKVGG